MKKAPFAAALAVLFVAACDPDAPPRFIEAETPDWAHSITVDSVRKRGATLTNAAGQRFHVSAAGTDIGDGLTAGRSKRRLYVTDQAGVKCNWNIGEKLTSCSQPNPAWAAYQQAKREQAQP